MAKQPIRGLVAAPHTPLHRDGSVNVDRIEEQAAFLWKSGVRGVFVCGATGEFPSLSFDERVAVQGRWLDVARGSDLVVIVHVGGNQLREARELAGRAEAGGAAAIAAIAPSYFRPATVAELVACCEAAASGAPGTPFYYYEIPALTGVRLAMDAFLRVVVERVPTFAGLKFTNPDLVQLQKCLALAGDELALLYGEDESLLAALELGVRGAVGSTYNFAPGLYRRMKRAFDAGDLVAARTDQRRSIQLVDVLTSYGYMGAAKHVMGWLGVDVGPPRLPCPSLRGEQPQLLRAELEALGFFEWRQDAVELAPGW